MMRVYGLWLCQGIKAAPARPRHCKHTTGHQHRSDKLSHHITHGHVAHRAPDTAVASHLHVILNHKDIYWGGLRPLQTLEQSNATCTAVFSSKRIAFSKLCTFRNYKMHLALRSTIRQNDEKCLNLTVTSRQHTLDSSYNFYWKKTTWRGWGENLYLSLLIQQTNMTIWPCWISSCHQILGIQQNST